MPRVYTYANVNVDVDVDVDADAAVNAVVNAFEMRVTSIK